MSYIGQPIGMVVARTQEAARDAAEWLQDNSVTYESKSPPTVTLKQAIDNDSYFYDKSNNDKAPSRLLQVCW